MGKPAARLGDMTAHGGVIVGPGCPTVLIGKMPAATMGDMHVCPMLTPGVPPIPHVGGPLIGPVPPTVFIGKKPAACVGDMAICVGPPSTILPPGCPTVLLGQSGGGGGGGGGGSLSDAAAAQALAAGALASISGANELPIELQERLAAATNVVPIETVQEMADQLVAAQENAVEETPFTIADVVEILTAVESEESYDAARFFASWLDFNELTQMAMGFISGSDTNPDNDPNIMPTRFMLLYGADDNQLQQIDSHPDCAEGEEHMINVENLRKGLRALGYEMEETGPYNDEVYTAHVKYMASQGQGVTGVYDEDTGESVYESFKIKLDIDLDDSEAQDDKFTLYSSEAIPKYKQVKTVKDDTDTTNDTLELVFTELDTSLKYSLEVNTGSSGNVELLFKNRPFGKWV